MAGSDFNGTGLDTSYVQATGQPGFGTGPSTLCAFITPDSAGQSNVGHIVGSYTAADAVRRRLFLTTGGFLRQIVQRTIASNHVANNRAVAMSSATKVAAFVAGTFDSTLTPSGRLFNSCDGTNAGEVAECTYGTVTNGSGTVNAGDTTYTVGNIGSGSGSATFDGGIAWAAWVPAILTLPEMQALAAGVNPVGVIGHYTNARICDLTDFANPREMTDNVVTWTATAITANDALLLPAGDGFATGGYLIRP